MKLKIYHGIKERTIIELPDDINAVAIDDRDIIFIDDTDHKRVYNVVVRETEDITLRLQQALPSTVANVDMRKLIRTTCVFR